MMKRFFEAPCARIVYVDASDVIATSNVGISDTPMGDGEEGDIREFYFYDEEEQDGWY